MKKIKALIWFPNAELPAPFCDIYDILDEDKMKIFIENFVWMTDYVQGEIKSNIMYARENTATFLDNLLSVEEPYLESYREYIIDCIENLDTIQPRYTRDSRCTYSIYESQNQNVKIENDCGLSEFAELRLDENDDETKLISIILNMNSISSIRKDIVILRDVYPDKPEFVALPSVQTPKELYLWLKDNREARSFTLSPKHGENGQGHWGSKSKKKETERKKASPLLCNRSHAKDKLIEAIGDIRNKEGDTDNKFQLYWYDENHSRYMIFQRDDKQTENTSNSYHGYHIEKKEIEKEIPLKIKQNIDRIREFLNQ